MIENAIFGIADSEYPESVTKMMNYNDLDARTIREKTDMSQLWDAWINADDLRRHSFRGSLGWEKRNGRDYLYSRKRGVTKSLGPRSPETEEILAAFTTGKAGNKAKRDSLSSEMDRQAGVLRSLNAGRLPIMAARTLRALRTHGKQAAVRVIGTNALYAYESLAGVVFNTESTATGDVDILVDDRNRLRLLTETDERIGLTRLIQSKVDRTFAASSPRDFRLTNNKGYMIEFMRPLPDPMYRAMPGAEPLEGGDIQPAPILGLQWLVNAPAIDVVVLDERGFPAPMRCPDPRYWAMHKLWLSGRDDRAPDKKIRDLEQARVTCDLIAEKLPHLPMNEGFLSALPGDLRKQIETRRGGATGEPSW